MTDFSIFYKYFMKNNRTQRRKAEKAVEEQKSKGKRINIQRQSSEYLRNVIYQSDSSQSSCSYEQSSSSQKPIQKKQQQNYNVRQPQNERDISSDEQSDYDAECLINGATAQKSKRFNNSSIFQQHGSKLSNQYGALQELNETIDEPKQDESQQISRFYLTKTPKLTGQIHKKQEKLGNDKKKLASLQGPSLKGFQFVKLSATNNTQQRRYPYRASREVPMLKFWQGEKMDVKRNGYWRKSN